MQWRTSKRNAQKITSDIYELHTNARKILFVVFLKQLAVRRTCACMQFFQILVAVKHFEMVMISYQIYRNIGTVVGNSFEVCKQLEENDAAVHGTFAGLQAFDVAELQCVLHLVDGFLQRLNM